MKKIAVIGLFCNGVNVADGQSIKTRSVARELEKVLGEENILKIDTYGWRKKPLRLLKNCASAIRHCANVVFLTDMGGIKVFPWLLSCMNVFAKRTIHYVVVGGWLVGYVPKHRLLTFFLKRLDGVFVETQVMQTGLQTLGFQNVHILPNFKDLSPLTEAQLCYFKEAPYKFCTFSRVMREKGIEEAIDAVKSLNACYGKTFCTLDIYGQVDPNQTQWFEALKLTFPDFVRYGGIVPYEKSVEVLRPYHALLFPTGFYTEGIPGTIIDAYAAGVPVVAAMWESFADVVDHGQTGIGYPFEHPEQLQQVLTQLVEQPETVHTMKPQCLAKASRYLPDAAMDILLSKLS